jgi:hypothetical protein
MNRAGRLTYVTIALATFFATTAFAANNAPLHVYSPIMAGESRLPVGEYTVQWEGAGPDVELKIKLDNRVKATIPAKVIPLDHPYKEDTAVLRTDADGDRSLREIDFAGKKFFLQIEPPTHSATAADPQSFVPECEAELPW